MSYYRTSAGGWNKTHKQAERTPRLDSFEIGDNCHGVIYIGNTLTEHTFLDYSICYHGDSEYVDFWYKGSLLKEGVEITHLQNGFGTSGQTFWICPFCGKRVRFIYLKDLHFRCRSCAKLNYKRQQDNVDWYRLGMEYAREHFAPPPFPIDGFAFSDCTGAQKVSAPEHIPEAPCPFPPLSAPPRRENGGRICDDYEEV